MKNKSKTKPAESFFEKIARKITHLSGTTGVFIAAVAIIILWIITGPAFGYSDTWQLVINTGTTVVTFLMVFLIQRSQNKDSMAIQLKLNELVAAVKGASNTLIDIEDLSEKELRALHIHYVTLAQMAKSEVDVLKSHSIEEAEKRHKLKLT